MVSFSNDSSENKWSLYNLILSLIILKYQSRLDRTRLLRLKFSIMQILDRPKRLYALFIFFFLFTHYDQFKQLNPNKIEDEAQNYDYIINLKVAFLFEVGYLLFYMDYCPLSNNQPKIN